MKFSALSTTIAIAAALTQEVQALGGVPNVAVKGMESIYGNRGQAERRNIKRQQVAQAYHRQYIPDSSNGRIAKREEEPLVTETTTTFVTVTVKRDGTTITPSAASVSAEHVTNSDGVEIVHTTVTSSTTRITVVTSTGEPKLPDAAAVTTTSTITPTETPKPETTKTPEPETTKTPEPETTTEAATTTTEAPKPKQTWTTVTMTTCETICSTPTATATPIVEAPVETPAPVEEETPKAPVESETPEVEAPEVPETPAPVETPEETLPPVLPPFPTNNTVGYNCSLPSNSTHGYNSPTPCNATLPANETVAAPSYTPSVIHSTFTVIPVAPTPEAAALDAPFVGKAVDSPVATPKVNMTIVDDDEPALFDGAANGRAVSWGIMALVGVVGFMAAL